MNNDSVKRFVAKVIISFENNKYFAAFYDPVLVRDGLGTPSGEDLSLPLLDVLI